jgi:tetratricopeptide (TPR) repeat protein
MLRLFLLFFAVTIPVFASDDALRDQITGLFKQHQWLEAQTILEKLTVDEPTNAEAWYYLAETFIARNDGEKALAAAEKATTLDPTQSRYFLQAGHAAGLSALKAGLFAKLGFAKQCKAAYDKAVELDPKSIDARWSVMEYCRQAPGFLGGGMDQAYAQAEEIKKLDARRGLQAYVILYTADKKYSQAFTLYEEVLRQKPGDGDALYNIGRLAALSGEQLDRGLAALREYVEKEPKANHARTYTRIGNILEKKGDKAGARTAYETAVAGDPKFVQAIEALKKLNET